MNHIILINYSELQNQKSLLEKIRLKFNLSKSENEYTELKKIITFNNQVTNRKI